MAGPLQDPYPEVELAPPPRALPLVEPRLISAPPCPIEPMPLSPLSCYTQLDVKSVSKTPIQAKRESYNLSGSTYLITNTGRTLKLPVPSNSKDDPLNWSMWKTAGAMFSVALFSIVCLTAAQAASVFLEGIHQEFQREAYLMVIDMTFINQRAVGVALMWSIAGCLGTSGVSLVPVITNEGGRWRCFYFYWIIPASISLIVSFFLFPETYFKRPTVAFDGMIVLQSATEKLTVYQDAETNSDIYRDLPDHPVRDGFAGFRDRMGLSRSPFASWVSMGRCYLQMGYCVVNPLIFWVFIVSAVTTAIQTFIGSTFARLLMAPPYNFSQKLVGTVSIATGVGSLCAFPTWFYLLCPIITRLSKRNRGVLEAEHYLIGYIFPAITGALSSLFYGMAVENQWSAAVFYLAYGLSGFSFVTLMIANTLWLTEAFPRWAAPSVAVVVGGTNLIGFWLTFALQPWIKAHGHQLVGIELMVLQLVSGFVALPVAFWGKDARQAIQGRWADDRSGALRPL
ncbi:hypothetical protein GQ44DRAFT_690010 [Phaeosphaeriaceae sp. PMI808]|nr:hypothetical protein GQ44DRAFT_690010 [Phaeosphaeriaceae sp. PMI808]